MKYLYLNIRWLVAPKERKTTGRGERSVTPANHAPSTLLAPKGRKNNNTQKIAEKSNLKFRK